MIRTLTGAAVLVLALADILWSAPPKPSAPPKGPLEILLPLGRTAYQTNEWIDVSVLRQSAQALPATDLTLSLTGADDSKLVFTFPLPAVAAGGTDARSTEHLHLNGRLLRPGNYTLEASAGGLTGKKDIEIYTHIRKTNFKLGDWGSRAKGSEQAAMGEDSLGFNTFYAAYGGISPDDLIRGGLDYMWNCTMGGGHQMDLRTECDWSDPYVLQGGTARVVRRAFADRTNPNCIGVHFYDEPGLTWQKHPVTKEVSPHNLPAQERAFRSAFDRDPPLYYQVQPDNPIHQAQWQHWGRWKLAFMDAAWKHAAFGVSAVRPDFLSVTQSVYGWNAFTDGYYFNVARTLPVISGHGGYDDFGGAYFNPGHVFEFGRMRDLARPNWYLPTWYGGMPANRFRMEQYLSFMNNLQGMFKPPDMQVQRPARAQPTADGIVESNKLMARLGTIFTTMPVTRPDVAVLYSISQNLNAQTHDMKDNYEGGKHGRQKTLMTYLAGLVSHVPLQPIVEEDVLDGTLAAHHKAVVLPGIHYLDPKVIAALEAFAAKGGTVLVSDESRVQLKGARKLGCPIDISFLDTIAELWKTQNHAQLQQLNTAGSLMAATAPLGATLLDHYRQLGLKPALTCDVPSVILSRQALGDVEYLFAVNATYDAERGGMNSIKPAAAKLSMPADGRPVYDAVLGEPAAEFREAGKHLSAQLRFGPGQMHVYARTPRPIGGVQVLTPTVSRDYTVAQDPLSVEIGAVVTDTRGRVLAGSIPLQVQVIDPLGGARYDLYRATDRGMFKFKLPLAVNDPAGKWQVVVRELLSNTEDRGSFTTAAAPQCGAIAGATPRAVYFGNERENVYRFFRTHKDITIAIGKSGYNEEAAQRLVRILEPWDIRCRIVNAADIKPRELAYEEANLVLPFLAPTFIGSSIAPQGGNNVPAVALVLYGATLNSWCGLEAGRVAAGRRNDPRQVGFGVRGPVVLLGTPEDNPVIAFVEQIGFPRPQPFLPYRPVAGEFPGRGRGMLAWQRDALRYGDESVTLIAHDSAGMAEAVGSLYEAASGLDPLTQYTLPAASSITVASKAPAVVAEPKVVWKTVLPDRAVVLKPLPGGGLLVLTQDGTLTALDKLGKLQWQQLLSGGESWALDVSTDGNRIAVGASQHLLTFDNNGKLRFDVPLTTEKPVPAVTFVAITPDGSRVAAGAVDGKLTLFDSTGKAQWTIGGVKPGEKVRPNPYLSGIFTADGKTLVALTANEAHVIDLANGTIARRTGGVNGSIAPQPVGDDLLLSDGNSAVWFSPAEGKIIKRVPLPPNTGVVSLVPVGEELIAGTEADGTVRKLRAVAGAAKEPPLWEHRVPRRLVKKVVTRDGQTAVAFWGGLVQVLDKNGTVKAARVFPQDVAALEWNGAGPVVALADGQVLAWTTR